MKYDINTDDKRWKKGNHDDTNRETMTYIETLRAMCDYYGTFCGRWHSNEFWAKTKTESETMTEAQAKEKVFEIENEAAGRLEDWRRYQ